MYTPYYILAVLIICTVSALPQPPELHSPPALAPVKSAKDDIVIVKSEFEDEGNGKFHWAYENSDGTKSEQRGYIKNPGTENAIQVIEGSFSYYSDGVLLTTDYIADENGYRPTGAHLQKNN